MRVRSRRPFNKNVRPFCNDLRAVLGYFDFPSYCLNDVRLCFERSRCAHGGYRSIKRFDRHLGSLDLFVSFEALLSDSQIKWFLSVLPMFKIFDEFAPILLLSFLMGPRKKIIAAIQTADYEHWIEITHYSVVRVK